MPSEVWVRINSDQLAYFSLLQLAELLADGRLSAQQLAGVFTSRLRRFDSLLHPVVTLTTELANQQAAAAQAALQAANTSAAASTRSSSTSPKSSMLHNISLLTGVPYGLKDLMAVPGYSTSWGLSQLRNRTINEPSAAYSALSAAGGVLLAKTATGELAWGDVWFNGITTRNPWNINTGSCGSSAGSAVAVAAGLLPFAVGTETWGSIVCPASTVGVTAYRPTGGSISGQGTMQVAPSLDKTGMFCRQLLDCAVVADALMDQQQQQQQQHAINASHAAPQLRLHRQPAAAAASFNYTQHQQTLQQTPPSTLLQQQQQQQYRQRGLLLPPTLQQLPALSSLCIGYLRGTSSNLVAALMRQQPRCVKGPLQPPGNNQLVQDVLSVILQAEVAVSLEGLWLEGYIDQDSHWYPLIQLGQVAPASAYLKAQRLRSVLAAQTRHYFAANGIDVLLKPTKSKAVTDFHEVHPILV
ncbi:hypothetical protein OEZ85_011795 [Tetradesmus obliquus]|uniref:Amidase domain-containing protein n=1 Tax=Tetradesmus obliquus TaxID=3088 RepID=A0ABY8TRE3_TETOB|nr:hypothetical protein OEZ85_011795 [Tetradesmus obliquus]